ncbi:polysaccharide biosynthesis protein [Glutamicibacter sp. BSL13]
MISAVVLRFEFSLESVNWLSTIILGVVAGLLHVAIGYFLGLYSGRFQYGSFAEVRSLSLSILTESILLTIAVLGFGPFFEVPRSSVLIAFPFALVLMFGVRYLRRLSLDHARKPDIGATATLVVGAGNAGELIIRNMMTDPDSPLRPVGLLDDDPAKKHLHLHGVQVLGGTDQIARVTASTGAEILVLAIANADAPLLRRLTDAGIDAGLRIMVIPTVQQLLSGKATVADLRSVKIEDLLGRHPVDTRIEDIAGYVTGKRVLVTGAGGSIGSELCRQLYRFGPKELIMLDRDETGLQQAQLGTVGHGLLDTHDVVLANIRDAEELDQIFASRRPEVVFHAAALKHLPLLEQYPDEAWKTNVLGTRNVVNAARSVGVSTFVNVSTDKAANPTSVLGHSKRVAEKITSWAAEDTGLRYLSVRFGNVIGSRGSMLPTFQSLIESGGPVTVTHPEATRYFMTIPEACQLVIQAGGIGRAGEVLILDMGEPVKILDVAKRMIAMSGKKIEIVFTGLRDGEKLHEELVGFNESLERPFHPQVSHTRAEPLAPERLDKAGWMAHMANTRRNHDTAVVSRANTEHAEK